MTIGSRLSAFLGVVGIIVTITVVLTPTVLIVGYAGKLMDEYAAEYVLPKTTKACIPLAGLVEGCYNK